MKLGGRGLPWGRRECAFPLPFVPPSHIPAADGGGAAEGREHEAEGTNKPVWYCSIAPSHHRWYDAVGVTPAWILARRGAPTRLL